MNAGKNHKYPPICNREGGESRERRGSELHALVAEHTGIMDHKGSQSATLVPIPWIGQIGN